MRRLLPCQAVISPRALLGVLALLCGGLQAQSTTNDPNNTSGSTLTLSNSSSPFAPGVLTVNSGTLMLANDPVVIGSSLTLSDGTVVNFVNTSSVTNTYTGATNVTPPVLLTPGTSGGTLILNGSSTVGNAALTISGPNTITSSGSISVGSTSLSLTSGSTITGVLTFSANNPGTLVKTGTGNLVLINGSIGTQTGSGLTINNGTVTLTAGTNVVTLASGGSLVLTGLSGSGIAVQLSKSSISSSTPLGNTGLSLSFTNSGTSQSSGTVVAALGSVPTGNTPNSASFTEPTVALIGIGNIGGQSIAERGVVYSLTTTSSSPTLGGTGVTKVVHTGNPDPTGGFSLTATGLAANTTYTYRVYTTDTMGATVLSQPLTFTTPTVLQNWRQTFFGSIASTGSGADSADPDGDGVPNLIEFATGKNPTSSSSASAAVSHTGSDLEYTYARSLDALNSGVTFTVEWNDTLNASDWSSAGVTEVILADDGLIQQVKATVPASGTGHRFVRLKVLPSAQSSNTAPTVSAP